MVRWDVCTKRWCGTEGGDGATEALALRKKRKRCCHFECQESGGWAFQTMASSHAHTYTRIRTDKLRVWSVSTDTACQRFSEGALRSLHQHWTRDSTRYVSAALRCQYGFAPPSGYPHRLHFESAVAQYCRRTSIARPRSSHDNHLRPQL